MHRSPIKVMIVDDEPRVRAAWQSLIAREPDMETAGSLGAADALADVVEAVARG